jgi:hypothetical protein
MNLNSSPAQSERSSPMKRSGVGAVSSAVSFSGQECPVCDTGMSFVNNITRGPGPRMRPTCSTDFTHDPQVLILRQREQVPQGGVPTCFILHNLNDIWSQSVSCYNPHRELRITFSGAVANVKGINPPRDPLHNPIPTPPPHTHNVHSSSTQDYAAGSGSPRHWLV